MVIRNGVRLHYSDIGSGPPVFWHTGGGGDGTMWLTAGYLDQLPGRRHLLFDHRGHGSSDRPEGVQAHSLEEYQADVIAVLDAAGIERAAMVGYSDGGRIVYCLAAKHPERVTALVGIGGVADRSDTNAWRRELAESVRKTGLRTWLAAMSSREAEPVPGWLLENLATTETEMFALECEGWADAPTECQDFPHITSPTLIICGEMEDTDGAAEQATGILPDGRAIVLTGFGHLQAFWRSDVTAPLIRDFLEDRVPGTASL
jgi:pimeloyl-ACP methyl ester carboxylesterase